MKHQGIETALLHYDRVSARSQQSNTSQTLLANIVLLTILSAGNDAFPQLATLT